MIKIKSNLLFKWFTPKQVVGIALFPFIFYKHQSDAEDDCFMLHERIHLQQQLELAIVPFYLWYIIEFIVRLWQYKSMHVAYRNISFEREAYNNEEQKDFLKQRGFWNFLHYL